MKRRRFLKTTLQTSALVSLPALSSAGAASANDRLNLGWIGCGGRGRFVARLLKQVPGVEFVAVCDVYGQNRDSAAAWVGGNCRKYDDYRKLLEQPDVDAVLIATPDHWHAIPTVAACQAGKDVYVEKPLAHNIREGRAMVRAARENDRVVQVGLQHRSTAHFEKVQQIIQDGLLGEVHYVRIWNFRNSYPQGIGHRPDSSPPSDLDWDFYLGPAPAVPYNRSRFLYSFRFFWDYAGGVLTDWGTHRLDTMHQVMSVDSPKAVSASGAHFALDDDGETPDVLQVTYDYPNFVLSYEACELNAHGCGGRTPGRAYYHADGFTDRPNGMAFYGTNGTLMADRLGFEVYPERKAGVTLRGRDPDSITPDLLRMQPQEGATPDSTLQHVTNFIECVRSRSKPNADVEIGHRSTIAAHLGNIAFKTSQKLKWDGREEKFIGTLEANDLLGRKARKPWDTI